MFFFGLDLPTLTEVDKMLGIDLLIGTLSEQVNNSKIPNLC